MSASASATKPDFVQLAQGLGTIMNFNSGDFLFREGDQPTYMYFILRGERGDDKPRQVHRDGSERWCARYCFDG